MSTSIRDINRARIISFIRRNPHTTRAELSRLTGLSKGTVSNHVCEMIGQGILYEVQEQAGQQRNMGLKLDREAGSAIGIELSSDGCRGVVTDVDIRPLKRVFHPLPSRAVEPVVDLIMSVAQDLIDGSDRPLLGLVVGVSGACDVSGQELLIAESLGWSGVPLAPMLQERLSCPVSLVNRPRAGVVGERWYGAGRGEDNLIYISVSSGIAAGIMIDGALLTGANNFAGEIGHTVVEYEEGQECVCGNHGCLETVASIPAIMRNIRSRLLEERARGRLALLSSQELLSFRDVVEAARNGDPTVLDEIRRACGYLGVTVANLIDIFNPRLVIIGGQLAEAGEIVTNAVRNTAQRRSFPLCFSDVQIVSSLLGLDSVGIGACALVVDQYLARVGTV